jgi:beta-phosphoglucomutase-like phosphatase (HAD superfamily)
MFDIDGTLTESNDLDDQSYVQALSEVFGFSEVSSDWTSYSHVTDACILKEVCQQQLGRVPLLAEVEAFQKRFLELLAEGIAASGEIKPVSGAPKMLSWLLDSSNHVVAYCLLLSCSNLSRMSNILKMLAAAVKAVEILEVFLSKLDCFSL